MDADLADRVTKENLDEAAAFAKAFAGKMNAVVAITGAIDIVADAEKAYCIYNGRPEMSSITGTGCQLSGMMTALSRPIPNSPSKRQQPQSVPWVWPARLAGITCRSDGNSTYRNRIIDAVYHMTGETLEQGARYEVR